MKEFEFSSKGAGMIHAYRWEPEGEPIAVVQIVHGIAEHAMRYDAFADFLTSHGVLVVAEDHMGHGKSHGSGAERYFAGGWCAAVDDTYKLLSDTRREFPQLPYFVFGHSMGSFMTRTLLFRYPDAGLRGAVICGTGWQPRGMLAFGRTVCALEQARVGEKGTSTLLRTLMFGAYNRKFENTRTPDDWICSVPEVVERYREDPLCGGNVTVGLARDLLCGVSMIQKKQNLKRMNPDLPVLFIAGKDDPVGNMGRGVKTAYEQFKEIGMNRVTMRLFDGRHEILNERHCREVYDFVWEFFRKLL